MKYSDLMLVGHRLKYEREKLGLTRSEMADKLEIVYSTYANYEKGNRAPSLKKLEKIAQQLGYNSSSDFLGTELPEEYQIIDNYFSINYEPIPVRMTHIQEVMPEKLNLLNDEGQELALDYVTSLYEVPKYQYKETFAARLKRISQEPESEPEED